MILLNLLLTLFAWQSPTTEIIDGYTNVVSGFPGDSIELYLNYTSPSNKYNIRLYDLNNREVASYSIRVFPQSVTNDKPYENGFGYKLTRRLAVPQLPSGVYLWDGIIPFVVKSRSAKITVVYSSNTINAYCNSGGKSLYGFNSTDGLNAQKVSFLRPLSLPRHSESFLRWMHGEQMADVGYITDMDLDDYQSIKDSKLLIVAGHSEYWTLQARKNFDRFIHSGNDALVLSGNTMWWQVRYNKAKNQLICHRDKNTDPIKTQKLKTVNWNDSTLQYPISTSIGAEFTYAGYGLKKDKGWDGYKLTVKSPLLELTDLQPGDILPCPSDETDGAPLTGFADGKPIVNNKILNFYKYEIIGYDHVMRGQKEGVATWIIFQPTTSSGTVINTALTDWCSYRGIGSSENIQKITRNMIKKLYHHEDVFSTDQDIADLVN